MVPCAWRILAHGRIAFGNGDHGHQFGLTEPLDGEKEAKTLLADTTVQAVAVRDDTGDLIVTFSEGMALEILNMSSGYEGWAFRDGTGFTLIALGGGELAHISG